MSRDTDASGCETLHGVLKALAAWTALGLRDVGCVVKRVDAKRSNDTYFCMKTTLNFDDRLIRAAKARAAQDGETLTRLIERALRDYLRPVRGPVRDFRARLVTKRGSALAGVDLDDRGLLYERMDGRD